MKTASLIFLFSSLLSSASALHISLPSQTALNSLTRVSWALDPDDETEWDFRFVKDGWDVGLAAANVHAGSGQKGVIDVKFPNTGDFVLVAVAGPEFDVIGQSLTIQVLRALPTSSSLPSTTCSPSVSVTTHFASSTTSTLPVSGLSPKSDVAALVGGLLGGLAFLLLLILLVFFIRRRRNDASNKPSRRFTFHSSWMVRPREPDPPSMSETNDNAGGLASGGPRGPRPGGTNLRPLILAPPRTERQQILDERVVELLEEISELPNTPLPGGRGMSERLGQIRRKIRWAREMKDSPWARGETDVRPMGWEECMV